MANIVVGAFATETEAVDAVRDLESKGYRAEDLLLLTSRDNADKLEGQTDIHVEDAVSDQANNESFMDKIKRAFMQDVGPEDNLSSFDKLISYGLAEDQAEEYSKSLEAGNMVIIANDRTGDSDRKTAPMADDNIDALDRTGRTNLASEDIESTSEYQNINANETEPSRTENRKETDQNERKNNREEEILEENPVLNKSTQERKGRSL